MIKLVENFREFMALASINQGPDGWKIYGDNPSSNSIIKDTDNFTLNYLNWLEERLDELVEVGEMSEVNKYDTLLNAKWSLSGATPSEITDWLTKYHGKDQTDLLIAKFQ